MLALDHPFKIHAWDAAGNRVEEEFADFANQMQPTAAGRRAPSACSA
jgi:hypothetical protein